MLFESPAGPAVSDARARVERRVERVAGPLRGRFNDVAGALGLEQVAEPFAEGLGRAVARAGGASDAPLNANAPRVLIASGYGFSELKLTLEAIIGLGLRLRGARPTALICDAGMSACEFNIFGNFQPSPGQFGPQLPKHVALATCARCTDASAAVFRSASIELATLASFGGPDDQARIEQIVDSVPYHAYRTFVYRDVQVGQQAFASVLRATLRGTLQDDDRTRWLFRRYMIASMQVVDRSERAFAALKPDHVLAIHGVYVTHGTLCETARRAGIPVVVFGVPYRQGTIWLSHGDSYHRTLVTEPHDQWEHVPLDAAQNARLDAYLDAKRGGGRDYVNYHPSPIEDRRRIYDDLALDADKPLITLFTNVLWDAQIYYQYNAFPDMLAWLFASIDALSKRPEVQLVIRIHPAEVKGGGMPTQQPILAELEGRYPALPGNVRVVAPESDVSSYALAEMSRACLIYGTKMGLEIAVRGVPVVVAGETFNRGKGFTYDIATEAAYVELLQRVELLPRNSPLMIERARRYAYYLYFRRMIDFPLIRVDDPHHSRGLVLQFDSIEDLRPGRDRALDTVCAGILEGKPFVI